MQIAPILIVFLIRFTKDIIPSFEMQNKSILTILKDEERKKKLITCMTLPPADWPYYSTKHKLDPKIAIPFLRSYHKSKKKFPRFKHYMLAFTERSLQQSSAEFSSAYKAQIMSGNRLVNLTGGLGADDWFLSESFGEIISIDHDKTLTEIAEWNLNALGIKNVERKYQSAEKFIAAYKSSPDDIFFIDPDRRPQKKKMITLENSSPNIFDLLPTLQKNGRACWVKLSPMIDLQYLSQRLGEFLEEIHLIAIRSNMKEVLIKLNFKSFSETQSLFLINGKSYDSQKGFEQQKYQWPAQKIEIESCPILEYVYRGRPLLVKSTYANYEAKNEKLFAVENIPSLYTSKQKMILNHFVTYQHVQSFFKFKSALKMLQKVSHGELVFYGFSKKEKSQILQKVVLKSNNQTIYFLFKDGRKRGIYQLERV